VVVRKTYFIPRFPKMPVPVAAARERFQLLVAFSGRAGSGPVQRRDYIEWLTTPQTLLSGTHLS
jgi:hypothetical protein